MKKLLILLLLTSGLAQAQVSTTFDRIFRQNGGKGLSQRSYSTSDSTTLSTFKSRNLYNPASKVADFYIQLITGNPASSGNIIALTGGSYVRLPVKPGTTYAFSKYTDFFSGAGVAVRLEDSDGAKLSAAILSSSGYDVITTPAGCAFLCVSAGRLNTSNLPVSNDGMQIEEGSIATAYVPYSGQDTPGSLNLFDYSQRITGQIVQVTYPGNTTVNTGSILTFSGSSSPKILVSRNAQITFSGYTTPLSTIAMGVGFFVGSTKVGQAAIPPNSTSAVVTTPDVAGAIEMIFTVDRYDATVGSKKDNSRMMVAYGASPSPFQLYTRPSLRANTIVRNGAPVSTDLLALKTDVLASSGGVSATDTLSFASADKIAFGACSYTEGGGIAVKNKGWINKVSAFTDYMVFNAGVGGDRFVDFTDRVRKNTAMIYTSRGIGVKSLKPRFITLNNVGNEVVNYTGVDTDLFREEIKEATEAVRAAGAFPIYSTDWLINNPMSGALFNDFANREGAYFHDQGTTGQQLLTMGSPAFMWWGTHPNVRGNAHAFYEWKYYLDRLPKPRKSIKVFRKRTDYVASSVQSLNWDSFEQRAVRFAEIQVGNRNLLDDSTGYNYTDRSNLAPSYTRSQIYTDEYSELLTGNPVSFTTYAAASLTLDKIRNNTATIYVKMAQNANAKFWLKNYFNTADYAYPSKSNKAVIVSVSKSVYDAASITTGDSYTTTQVRDGSAIAISLVMKGKYFSPSTGYIIGFETAGLVTPTTLTTGTSGSLTRTSGTGTSSIAYTQIDANLSTHSFAFIATQGQPEGSFSDLTSTNTAYASGYYAITLSSADLALYSRYDNIKLVVEVPGVTFTISDIYVTYSGGAAKTENKTWYSPKHTYTEKLATKTFDANWTTTGGWTNSGASLTAISSPYRDYPALIAPATNHVDLLLGVDNAPGKITRTISLTARQGYRKAVIRVVARVFPKFFRPDLAQNTYELTTARQITADSYDYGTLCLGLKGNNISTILRSTVDIGWQEQYFEVTIPPGVSSFDIELFRDWQDVIDPINYRNHTYPLQICYVSVQVEGE